MLLGNFPSAIFGFFIDVGFWAISVSYVVFTRFGNQASEGDLTMRDTIALYRTAKGWMARFSDRFVAEEMGTDTLPAPWSACVDPETVLSELRKMNPDSEVTLDSDRENWAAVRCSCCGRYVKLSGSESASQRRRANIFGTAIPRESIYAVGE